jgi:uncharacterized damage-inducible protein DinB
MQDLSNIIDGLKRSPAVLSDFIEDIPEAKLNLRRGDRFWTIAEHASHLAQVQPMLLTRLERFRDEAHPEFIPFFPGDGEDEPEFPLRMDMDLAVKQFAVFRKKQAALIEAADAVIHDKTGVHPEYEQYTLPILARHILMHDYWHMYRMEELWLTRDAFLTRLE